MIEICRHYGFCFLKSKPQYFPQLDITLRNSKTSWPELVGEDGDCAVTTIEKENKLVNAQTILEGTIILQIYICDRNENLKRVGYEGHLGLKKVRLEEARITYKILEGVIEEMASRLGLNS
uniref:Uncharacterized protein n=1 Tax=Lactuca sativa TaxID=4236 RepID=A0A9R1W3J7_LACSA|nr:hypothetical protein LSAT_V11C300150800 [Lactuca sativa]